MKVIPFTFDTKVFTFDTEKGGSYLSIGFYGVPNSIQIYKDK